MIPSAYLTEWAAHTLWPDPRQVDFEYVALIALTTRPPNSRRSGRGRPQGRYPS